MKISLNMRFKIFFMALIANLFAIILIASLFYQKSADFFNKQYAQAVAERLYIGNKHVDTAFKEVYRICLDISFNERIKNILIKSDDSTSDNRNNLSEIHSILKSYREQNNLIDNIYCYIPKSHKLIKSEEYNSLQTIDLQTALLWEEILQKQDGMKPLMNKDIFTASSKNVYLYKSAVTAKNGEIIAYIVSTISERSLYYKYLDDIVRDGDSIIYMFDYEGHIVSSNHLSNNSLELFDKIQEHKLGQTDIKIDNKNYLAVYTIAPFSQYAFCLAVNKNIFLQKVVLLQVLIISCSLIILVLSSIAIYFMALKLNKPIEELAMAMRQVSNGDLTIKAKVYNKDEIGYLAVRFNYMISRIRKLIEDVANEQAKKKEAELNALQYQIRPHFIYNTLNAIRFASLMQGAKNIGTLLGNFIELLQVSTNRKGSFAPLSEEISTLKNYIAIQEFRTPDTFYVEFIIDEQTKACIVPRLILQPLVENSVIHGLSESKDFCNIIIRSYLKNNLLYLEVEDDGKGMSVEQMKKFNEFDFKSLCDKAKQTSGGYSSIGVFNIIERLHLYYGKNGVLCYDSDGESYTLAKIQLPISKYVDEYKL